jgi:hypothetical protein
LELLENTWMELLSRNQLVIELRCFPVRELPEEGMEYLLAR